MKDEHNKRKLIKVVKGRIRVKTVTIARRKNNTEFEENEAAFYKNLTETNQYTGNPPNIEEFEDFWANIWETEGKINRDANWLGEIKREINNEVKTPTQSQVVVCRNERFIKISLIPT